MSNEAQKLMQRIDHASRTAAVMMTGLSPSLVLLNAWIESVETRLAAMEFETTGNTNAEI